MLQPLSCDICNTGTGLGFGIVDDVYGNVRVNTILADSPAAKVGLNCENIVNFHDYGYCVYYERHH